MTKIKICGLYRDADVDFVNEAGPDYAGFILLFPKSHRNLTPERAAVLRKRLDDVYFAEPAFSADNAAGTALLCRRRFLTD